MAVNKVMPPDLAFAGCPRCGGIRVEGDAVEQWFHWLRKYGWQGAVQYVITHCAWGVLAWHGSRRDPDGRVVCLLVEDEHLAAALTEVLERIEAGRTRPLLPSSEGVTWEEWAPEEAQAAPAAPGTGQARVGAIDWVGGGVTLAHPAALVVPAAGDALPGVIERELQAYLAERQRQSQRAVQEEALRRPPDQSEEAIQTLRAVAHKAAQVLNAWENEQRAKSLTEEELRRGNA